MGLNSETLSTTQNRVQAALDLMTDLTNGNVYLGIGGNSPWASNDILVQVPVDSTDYLNQVHRNLVALKQLSISGAALVIPRNDWVGNTYVYAAYSNALPMFSTVLSKKANGTINCNNSTTTVTGVNTTFQLDFQNNNFLEVTGDGINIFPQTKEVINVVSNTVLVVNSTFSATYVSNTPYNISNTAPNYGLNWYVRNSYDQVFVCLGNNNGTLSNTMPQISVGGDLPTDSYIITTDGYLWKYLYTINAGAKKLFFNQSWMPVLIDTNVLSVATPGEITVINIMNGGSGYNGNVAEFNAPIITVTGDGTGANVTAQVNATGVIYGLNIISGGEGYTIANVTANGTGSGANLQAVINPRGDWGGNNYFDLGATTLMITTALDDTENGTIPTVDFFSEYFKYRQLSIIANPTISNGNTVANATNYKTTTAIQVAPTNIGFLMNDIAYQGNNIFYSDAFFSGTVVWYDAPNNTLYLNNISGTFQPQFPIYGISSSNTAGNPYVTTTAFSLTKSPINTFSGQDLYVENSLPISRYPLQQENIMITLQF